MAAETGREAAILFVLERFDGQGSDQADAAYAALDSFASEITSLSEAATRAESREDALTSQLENQTMTAGRYMLDLAACRDALRDADALLHAFVTAYDFDEFSRRVWRNSPGVLLTGEVQKRGEDRGDHRPKLGGVPRHDPRLYRGEQIWPRSKDFQCGTGVLGRLGDAQRATEGLAIFGCPAGENRKRSVVDPVRAVGNGTHASTFGARAGLVARHIRGRSFPERDPRRKARPAPITDCGGLNRHARTIRRSGRS